MSELANCPTCGNPLPSGGRTAGCPCCLLLAGMSDDEPEASDLAEADFPHPVLSGPREAPGTLIGRYRLLEEIGEGGFAIVYLAEQTAPVKRRVALKILKPGMDTREVVVRFEAERQTLALMDHPHIAQVYDGGCTNLWRPYFVMELVDGMPLTKYCDAAHLAVRQRLELMLDVLAAVQHAHQKGIIHRDLKPSNILVSVQDGKPVVKVIDFGIAKALATESAGRTTITGQGRLIGTPEYMSPEQAASQSLDVDTRSDVYALGVVLYELLTSRTPHEPAALRAAGQAEIQRLLNEVEPPKPSTRLCTPSLDLSKIARRRGTEPTKLHKQIRGDLDWIVMKALEKDRARRYSSASSLASDIQRFLSDEPVIARPPSVGYRFGKFARRNKTVLALVTLIALILVAATIVSAWEVVIARRAEAEAEELLRRARQAEAEAEDLLRRASLSEARALRNSGEAGRRIRALQSLQIGNDIRFGPDLRDEIVPILGVADLQPKEVWPTTATLTDLAAVAPDFLCHATSAADGTVRIFGNPPTVKILATLPGTGPPVKWVLRFSPNASLLAIGHALEDKDVVDVGIWDWRKTQRLATLTGVIREAVDFSPDSSLVAAGIGRDLVVVDLRTGKELRRWPGLPGQPYSLRFRPDGEAVAVSFLDDATVTVIDITTGRVLAADRFTKPLGIAWHRDNHRLAVAWEGNLTIWSTLEPTGKVVIAVAPKVTIDRVAWSHRTELLASTGVQQPVTIYDGNLGQKLVVDNGDVKDLCFSPDDTRLGLTWAEDELGLFEIADGALARHAPGNGEVVVSAAWYPDGGVLATLGDETLRFWNREMRDIGGLKIANGRFAAFTPGGLVLVADTVRRYPWQWVGEPPVLHLGPPEILAPRGGWQSASITTDGRLLAVAGPDQVTLFELENPERQRQVGRHSRLNQAALSPHGEWLATATDDGYGVKVWNTASRDLVAEFPTYPRCRVSFSHDGKWLVVATGSGYHFHRVGSWELAHEIKCRLGADLGWLAWSPRDTVIVIEPEDYMLSIHELRRFELQTSPQFEHQRPLNFSPEGSQLITTDPQHRIHLWDLALVRAKLVDLHMDFEQLPQLPRSDAPLVEGVVFDHPAPGPAERP
jgi:serine/threonine protein kinase/WD40 repeat protein